MMDTKETNTLTLSILGDAFAYNRWVFEKIRPFLGKDILEVGCGIGNLTGLLMSHGNVVATDVNKTYLEMVERKYRGHVNLKDIFIWNIEENPFGNINPMFDTIVCSNVLEHIKDDDVVLKHFYGLLPQGGKLILLVPALRILHNLLDRELGHFRRYNRKALTKLLAGNGFEIRYLNFFNLFGTLGWFINGTLLRRRFLSSGQISLFNKMVPLFIKFEKVVPTFVGQSLIAVGERN